MLPGLCFQVPKEMGTADRPLFAFRTHMFIFHVIRHVKMLLTTEGGPMHILWPQESGLMTSPCGAAGIDLTKLAHFCGTTRLAESPYQVSKLPPGHFRPYVFGECVEQLPNWLS